MIMIRNNEMELDMLKRTESRTTSLRPDGFPFGQSPLPLPVPPSVDMEHTVLLLAMNKMQSQIDNLTDLVRELRAEMSPRYIGTAEACKILGVGRTVMMDRLKSGYYPFAFKDNSGHWRMSTVDLYRFQKQM